MSHIGVMVEALQGSCWRGRTEILRWLLDQGPVTTKHALAAFSPRLLITNDVLLAHFKDDPVIKVMHALCKRRVMRTSDFAKALPEIDLDVLHWALHILPGCHFGVRVEPSNAGYIEYKI
jgi:hypothetical protein